jgi:hypothetical protein
LWHLGLKSDAYLPSVAGYELPRAPRAPSPEPSSPSSFEELEIRHR